MRRTLTIVQVLIVILASALMVLEVCFVGALLGYLVRVVAKVLKTTPFRLKEQHFKYCRLSHSSHSCMCSMLDLLQQLTESWTWCLKGVAVSTLFIRLK